MRPKSHGILARLIPALTMSALVAVSAAVTGPGTAHAADTRRLYNDAQSAFARGDAGGGLARLDELLRAAPGDADALALQAIWADYAINLPVHVSALGRLAALNPGRKAGVDNLLTAIRNTSLTPPNPFPALIGGHTAIVVLGYGLLPNGALRPELIARLEAARLQAFLAPFSPVIVTGGNPRNGITEAAAMQGWLQANGIPAGRIHAEHSAASTVGNALATARMIHRTGASSAVVVTSADHIRRATVDFIVAGVPVVGAMSTTSRLMSQLPPLNKAQQRGMFLDATRVFGLPASR